MKLAPLALFALLHTSTVSADCLSNFKVYKDKDCTDGEIRTNYGVKEWNRGHNSCQKKGDWYYQVECNSKEVTYRQYHDPDCKHERIFTQTYQLDKCQPMGHNSFTSKSMHKYKFIIAESAEGVNN